MCMSLTSADTMLYSGIECVPVLLLRDSRPCIYRHALANIYMHTYTYICMHTYANPQDLFSWNEKHQFALRRKFAYGVPTQYALDIAKHYQPLVEIGAGTGTYVYA